MEQMATQILRVKNGGAAVCFISVFSFMYYPFDHWLTVHKHEGQISNFVTLQPFEKIWQDNRINKILFQVSK
jgi:hypothetical protein